MIAIASAAIYSAFCAALIVLMGTPGPGFGSTLMQALRAALKICTFWSSLSFMARTLP